MENILGKQFRRGPDLVDLENLLEAKDFICIYFGAHWAPPCRLFTPTLADFYTKVNAGQKLIEIIFCSIDGNEAAFERNYAEMPWTAIPFTDE